MFNPNVLTAYPVFYRTYARRLEDNSRRETEKEQFERVNKGLLELGQFTEDQERLILDCHEKRTLFQSGRSQWCLGTDFVKVPKNFPSLYNCNSIVIENWDDFGYNFSFLMMGCGSAAVLEEKNVCKLPVIKAPSVSIEIIGEFGNITPGQSYTEIEEGAEGSSSEGTQHWLSKIIVGDSREGWVETLTHILHRASSSFLPVKFILDISNVRPKGSPIKGFGGKSNPVGLKTLYINVCKILNNASGRKLTPIECSLILNESGKTTVAGNVRRSARLDLFDKDNEGGLAKLGLWTQDEEGNWIVDPEKDCLRMANFTRVWHKIPDYTEIYESVKLQHQSGEGAIMYAPECIARGNADILYDPNVKKFFLESYEKDSENARQYLIDTAKWDVNVPSLDDIDEVDHRMNRYGVNPCLTGDMHLLTNLGYLTFEELATRDDFKILSSNGDSKGTKVWCSGEKEVVAIRLTTGKILKSTPDHLWMTTEGEYEAKDLKGTQLVPFLQSYLYDDAFAMYGFIQGDGNTSRLLSNEHLGIEVNIGDKDSDTLKVLSRLGWAFNPQGSGRTIYLNEKNIKSDLIELGFSTNTLPSRVLPTTYKNWDQKQKASFLCGLYSANGSVLKKAGRVTLKSTCLEMLEQVQDSLKEDFGIESYITTNKTKEVVFDNGCYLCRESYDLNISRFDSKTLFFNNIAFFLDYKIESIREVLLDTAPKVTSVKTLGVQKVYDFTEPLTHWGSVEGFLCHNCAEILGSDFFCNLNCVHLNNLDVLDVESQYNTFYAAGLSVSAFLNHKFEIEKFQQSRDYDPIVGVSFAGLFDFFTELLGSGYLTWWKEGRKREPRSYLCQDGLSNISKLASSYPEYFKDMYTLWVPGEDANLMLGIERAFLELWKKATESGVKEYCTEHGLKTPNRCTTVQPTGTQSLLTGATPGWHPPKALQYIRRITFSAYDPVAMAGIDCGYQVIPSQSCKDENGKLLDDPFDPRVNEWLLEIPCRVSWYNLAKDLDVDPNLFSAKAQFDFWMQVQKYYSTHSTSATIELRESEIQALSDSIFLAITTGKPFTSVALLSRFDDFQSFPRLPIEPCSEEEYERRMALVDVTNFYENLLRYDTDISDQEGPSGCDSTHCTLKEVKAATL